MDFDVLLRFVEETSPNEFQQRVAKDRNAVWQDMIDFAVEFLARPWTNDVLDRIGEKCVAFSDSAKGVDSYGVIRQEVIYILCRLLGERNRQKFIEPFIRLMNECEPADLRLIAKSIIRDRTDVRCRNRVGGMLDLNRVPHYIQLYIDPQENRKLFYDDPAAFAEAAVSSPQVHIRQKRG